MQMAVDALKRRRQAIAFDANVEREYRVGTAYSIACLKEYERLSAEIEGLEMMLGEKKEKKEARRTKEEDIAQLGLLPLEVT